jgi:hypothetical protein
MHDLFVFTLAFLGWMFIPRPPQAISQINAVGEYGQSGWFEHQFLASSFDVLGPAESTLLKAF